MDDGPKNMQHNALLSSTPTLPSLSKQCLLRELEVVQNDMGQKAGELPGQITVIQPLLWLIPSL